MQQVEECGWNVKAYLQISAEIQRNLEQKFWRYFDWEKRLGGLDLSAIRLEPSRFLPMKLHDDETVSWWLIRGKPSVSRGHTWSWLWYQKRTAMNAVTIFDGPKVGSLHTIWWWTLRTGVLITLKRNCYCKYLKWC